MNQLALFGRIYPPKWRELTAALRELNTHFDGPGAVSLNFHGVLVMCEPQSMGPLYGREEIPGDGRSFDAPAAARRLLAALRAGEESAA